MLLGRVKGRSLTLFQDDHITSGSVGLPIRFIFDDEWDGLTKIVYFRTERLTSVVSLVNDECVIPPEVLTGYENPLWISVAGIGDDYYIPTTWWRGSIEYGAELPTTS